MMKASAATRLIEYTTVTDSAPIVGIWPFSEEQQTYVLVVNDKGAYVTIIKMKQLNPAIIMRP
mgnify:CR=1 FL=1